MKKTNLSELRSKTEQELKETFLKVKKDVESHVSEILKGKEKNVKKAVFLRKEMARLQTVLNEMKFLKGTK